MNIKLLKNKNIFLLLIGKFVSNLGTRMQNFVLALYLLESTHSAITFASVLALADIPMILLQPFGGVIADRFDRKKILVYLDIISAIIIGIFVILFKINGGLSVAHIYILVFSLAVVSAIFNPASECILPSIVKKDKLVSANSMFITSNNIIMFLSPLIAGLLYKTAGLYIVLIINCVSFFISSISELYIDIPKVKWDKSKESSMIKSFAKDFLDGFRYIKTNKILISMYMLVIIYNFAYGPLLTIGLPYIIINTLGGNELHFSFVTSCMMGAIVIGPFLTRFIKAKFSVQKTAVWSNFITTVLLGGLIVISSPILSHKFNISYVLLIITLVLTVLVRCIGGIFISSWQMEIIPQSYFGRIFAFGNAVSLMTIPLGKIIFGWGIDNVPIYLCISVSVLILLIASSIFKKSLDRLDLSHKKEM